jgi:hypothetical protein
VFKNITRNVIKIVIFFFIQTVDDFAALKKNCSNSRPEGNVAWKFY